MTQFIITLNVYNPDALVRVNRILDKISKAGLNYRVQQKVIEPTIVKPKRESGPKMEMP
jgi:hypothetical protein